MVGALFNCTGTLDVAEWHDLLSVNLHSAFFTLHEGAKAVVARSNSGEPGGSLVNYGGLSLPSLTVSALRLSESAKLYFLWDLNQFYI